MGRTLIPGFRFGEGRLLVFTEEEVMIIYAWPDLEAVRRQAARRTWKPFVPCFRLLRPRTGAGSGAAGESLGPANFRSRALDPEWERQAAFASFRHSIPGEVAAAVEGFTSRQWALLAMCRRRRLATELLEQNPAVGFSVAHNHKFRLTGDDPAETAARLSVRRQREIIGWLGFPDSQAWVKILSRIPAEVVSLERLRALQPRSRHAHAEKMLSHLALINAGVLALVTEPALLPLVTPSLVSEVAQSPAEMRTPEVAHLLMNIAELHGQMEGWRALSALRSIEEARTRQQELVDEFGRFLKQREEDGRLPAPPLPGTADIVPLVHGAQLQEEGLAQHNCVGGYVDWVKRGEGHIYRVLAPERATLSIVRGADGCWEIQQLSLSRNRPVSDATRQAVQKWLGPFSLSV